MNAQRINTNLVSDVPIQVVVPWGHHQCGAKQQLFFVSAVIVTILQCKKDVLMSQLTLDASECHGVRHGVGARWYVFRIIDQTHRPKSSPFRATLPTTTAPNASHENHSQKTFTTVTCQDTKRHTRTLQSQNIKPHMHLPREPSCRLARAHERLRVSGTAGRGKIPESEDRTCMVCGVDDEKLTREARLEFCEADVRKPLASAVRVAKAGNGIWLEAHGGYIENLATKERAEVREENGVYVMDVQFDDETVDVITLDSGAVCDVWPKGRRAGETKLLRKKAGVGMVAAKSTPIEYHGQRQVRFRGVRKNSSFHRPR